MTASISTAMSTSFKAELFEAGHCFNATVTPTADLTSSSTSVTSVSSMAGVAVGMAVTGTGVPSGTYVATITSSSAFTLSQAATAAETAVTLTISGDTFNMALIDSSYANTYGAANVNYTDIGSDEVPSGNGYTTGGNTLTNVSATTSGTTAFITFSPDTTWSSATFSTVGCMIYNASVRAGGTSGSGDSYGGGRCCSVHSFNGTQSVTSGTFTVIMPTASAADAILRLS